MQIVGGLNCICSKSSRFVEADISHSGKKVGQMRALVELMAATRGGLESLRWAAPTNQGSCSSLTVTTIKRDGGEEEREGAISIFCNL